MKLVLIHGRDQQGKNPADLQKVWMDTWREGLVKNGLEIPKNLRVVFPFYGDLLDKLIGEAQLPQNPVEVFARGDFQEQDLEFFNDFLMDLAVNADVTNDQILNNFEGDIRERGPLNWGWIQAILKTLDGTQLANWSLKKFTFDAYMYLAIEGIKRKVNDFISEEIGKEDCVIVGHSLGSVVAYNILRNCTLPKVKKFITIGSPLGLRSFKDRLEKPIIMPKCILGGWFNAYDERDYVALQPLNKAHFNIDPAIENYNKVENQTKNRHGIEGYLNDKYIAKVIVDSLVKI